MRILGTSWRESAVDQEWQLQGDYTGHVFATVRRVGASFLVNVLGAEVIRPNLEDAQLAGDKLAYLIHVEQPGTPAR